MTAVAKEAGKPVPALERAAVLLNLAGASGLQPADLQVAVVLHGGATYAAMDNKAFRDRIGRENENAILIERLVKAGVKVLVCGQSLVKKEIDRAAVRTDVLVAASALTAVVNRQRNGFASVPSH